MRTTLLLGFLVALLAPCLHAKELQKIPEQDVKKRLQLLISERFLHLEALYQQIHKNPELSGKETTTAQILAKEWRQQGLEVTENVGGTGVVAILKNGAGPVGLLRTELDGLPIQETTRLPYQSQVAGAMHACGHDVHIANLVGVSYALSQMRELWHGTLIFIGQPAEETGHGAKQMIQDGLFKRFPKPEYALAMHIFGDYPADTILYRSGALMAGATSVNLTFFGKSGHGALPHLAIDPFILAAEMTLKLQTLIGREISALEPALVSVGSIHGGTKHNIIPDSVKMQLTIRALNIQVKENLKIRLREIAEGIATTNRAPQPSVEFPEDIPPTFNDPKLMAQLLPAFQEAVGSDHLIEHPPVMPSEDFGLFGLAAKIPSVAFWIGPHAPGTSGPHPVNHSSQFAPAYKSILTTGITAISLGIIKLQKGL